MASKIFITKAGRNALFNADRTGTGPVKLASVGYGTGKYTATESMTALKNEFKRINTIAGVIADDSVISLRVVDRSSDVYTVNEFGIYTDSGVLFAIYSQSTAILQKAADSVSHLAIDIKVEDIDVKSITFGDTNFETPQATTEAKGVVELATVDESLIGEDSYRAVTPLGLNARAGVVEEYIQSNVLATINDLNDRVVNGTLTPFCVNKGPLDANGIPNALSFVNRASSTTDVAFVQPSIRSNGTMGGSSFAVNSSPSRTDAYLAVGAGNEFGFSDTSTPSESNPHVLTVYNPEPIKLSSVSLANASVTNRIWKRMRLKGSLNGSSWTSLGDFQNSNLNNQQMVTVSVSASVAYKYFRFEFIEVNGKQYSALLKGVTLNGTTSKTINGGTVSFKGPLVATTAQGEKFTVDAVSLDVSNSTARTLYVYLNRAGVPVVSNGFHDGETTPSNYQVGDVWLQTLEPLNSFYWSGSEWVQVHLAPVGEVYLDGKGKVTGVSTYPYNQNGYTVNVNTVATATTFGLVRTAATSDETNCTCTDAAITPANLADIGDYRQASTSYKVGDRVRCMYHADRYLQCIQAGKTNSNALTVQKNANIGSGFQDGTVFWQVVEDVRVVNVGNARERSAKKPTYGLA